MYYLINNWFNLPLIQNSLDLLRIKVADSDILHQPKRHQLLHSKPGLEVVML